MRLRVASGRSAGDRKWNSLEARSLNALCDSLIHKGRNYRVHGVLVAGRESDSQICLVSSTGGNADLFFGLSIPGF